MYVDDTQIFASSHDKNELIVKLNSDLAQVRSGASVLIKTLVYWVLLQSEL